MRWHLKKRGPNSRWFPGQWVSGYPSGWLLANGEHWAGADTHAIDLASLVIHPPSTLTLSLVIDSDTKWTLQFDGLSELQVDGDLQLGRNENGWEVMDMGLSMLIADRPRDDERVVYGLELPSALICFASFPPTRCSEPLQLPRHPAGADSK
ncbi:MAG: hypothetical protein IT193_20185 [Propionibacteriaceae bacterium]|nr:hypothetical protein [Propionibacteriaceae bacterium]